MGSTTGFMDYPREELGHRPIAQRVCDYREMDIDLPDKVLNEQAARCMDCGIPFCHGTGCPVTNRIPEFNDLVYQERWQEACENLHTTNNFPEITGRICPAPCEESCTLNIDTNPVMIKHIERRIVERGFAEGWITPKPAKVKTGCRIAVVGSGPAGLAAAQQLSRAGHDVIVYEKDPAIGGLLRFGIPDFKLEKHILDRRIEQMEAEGVQFEAGVTIGEDLSLNYLRTRFDAVLLAMGAGQPRDLPIEGRQLDNVYYAMDFLTQQNRINAELPFSAPRIDAKGKVVVVIGGGDTGSDCIGTARRQGAKEIHQFEILPQPPETRAADDAWPDWPRRLRTSTSQEEGCQRRWSVLTKKLIGQDGAVTELVGCQVEWAPNEAGQYQMAEVAGSDFTMQADLVLLAMGFVHVTHAGLVEKIGCALDGRGNVVIGNDNVPHMTSEAGIFSAGDTDRGASLVVWAIREGRDAAASIDTWLRQAR